jgi:hypothetical protein
MPGVDQPLQGEGREREGKPIHLLCRSWLDVSYGSNVGRRPNPPIARVRLWEPGNSKQPLQGGDSLADLNDYTFSLQFQLLVRKLLPHVQIDLFNGFSDLLRQTGLITKGGELTPSR